MDGDTKVILKSWEQLKQRAFIRTAGLDLLRQENLQLACSIFARPDSYESHIYNDFVRLFGYLSQRAEQA